MRPAVFWLFSLAMMPVFSGLLAHAQAPPPPPPPRKAPQSITSVPATAFEPKDGGFKIAFPAKPTESSRESDTSFGKAKMSSYLLPTTVATYNVVHIDFPTSIKDKFDLDTRFDAMRDNQVKIRNARVMTESEFYYGSHYGRDLVMEDASSTNWLRVIMVEQRLFVLSVVTPGNHSRQSAALKASSEARVKTFFDSFTVTEVPKPQLTTVELPADFGVKITPSTFASTFLDVSFDLPKGWVVLNDSESAMLLELGAEELGKTKPRLAEYLTSGGSRILLTVSKTSLEKSVSTSLLLVAAERVAYPNFLPMSAVKSYMTTFMDATEKVVKGPALENIGGLEFAWVETYDSAAKEYQRIYFANRKGVAFEFSLTYTDPGDLQVMQRSIGTLRAK